jgi:hypothetical protein
MISPPHGRTTVPQKTLPDAVTSGSFWLFSGRNVTACRLPASVDAARVLAL